MGHNAQYVLQWRRNEENNQRERERLELSQRQLAALVGVGKTTIGEIERGERLPNVVTAIRIAKALHTTVEELWSEDYYGQ